MAAGDSSAGDETTSPDLDAAKAAVDAADAFRPTGQCASAAQINGMLSVGFGRIDGTVYAVQKPSDTMCVFPNKDHVIVQVLMKGSVYRLVANVQSDRAGADPQIRIGILPHALPAPAWAEGWHLGAALDYVTTLGAHSDATFTALSLADASTKIATEVKVGDLVSVYATVGTTELDSAHLIHRNAANADGAIVLNATTSPRFMLFHFDNQTF